MSDIFGDKVKASSLLKFSFPTIIMMVFMAMYTMVDGIFVSNLIGESALSAVNIVYPFSSIVIALSIMLATGGGAIIARNMGEGKGQTAKENFSLIVLVGIGMGVLLLLVGLVWLEPLIRLMGATPLLYDYCMEYMGMLTLFAPFAVLQMLFQFFFVTAGKPNLGLFFIASGGVVNVVLDYVFMAPMNMGIKGAALATGLGYCVPAIAGLIYFAVKRNGVIYFVKPKWNLHVLVQSCLNGSSEMVTNLATAVTTFLFNIVMIRYLGENGVAAITIVLYSQFLLTSIYLGYSSGVAPVFSYNYGKQNKEQLKRLYRISIGFIGITSLVTFFLSLFLAGGIVSVFVRPGSEVYEISRHGFLLFSICYLFIGINIFASSMFTAFSNGLVSAVISFLRTFVLIIAAVLILPYLIGTDGIWLAIPTAELLTLVVSIFYFRRYRSRYHYG